ncbi:MAG: DUF4091 domain-containing protein [Phycisphaera sp.]|nr:DUF4091 domain-containing protein [Phycisphaera sp.]
MCITPATRCRASSRATRRGRPRRVSGQFVIWTGQGLTNAKLSVTDLKTDAGQTIAAERLVPSWVRYVLGGKTGPLVGDILEPSTPIDVPAETTRPIWLSINVPRDAAPGVYKGTLNVTAEGGRAAAFELSLEVLPATLPPVADWSIVVDIWPDPWGVATAHHVEMWSDEHWAELKKVLAFAADMGDNCLMVFLQTRAWTLVPVTHRKDGSWSFDYGNFDRYVELAMACGLNREIKCMIPGSRGQFRYFDEVKGEQVTIDVNFSDGAFTDPLKHYLTDLDQHLRSKGWFDKANVHLDEPSPGELQALIALVDSVDPQLKIGVAASKGGLEKAIDRTDDFSFIFGRSDNPQRNIERTAAGKFTTFYVCAYPGQPNTFTWSGPDQATWLGWYTASQRYDGFLRWALCRWQDVSDPFVTTSHEAKNAPAAGDFFLMYPGPRSSVRFERLREGFEDYEKVRIVREKLLAMGDAGKQGLQELDAILAGISIKGNVGKYGKAVHQAQADLEAIVRRLWP